MNRCGFQPADLGYAPCTREAYHDGPCAHPLAKPSCLTSEKLNQAIEMICFNAVGRDDLSDDCVRWLRKAMHAQLDKFVTDIEVMTEPSPDTTP